MINTKLQDKAEAALYQEPRRKMPDTTSPGPTRWAKQAPTNCREMSTETPASFLAVYVMSLISTGLLSYMLMQLKSRKLSMPLVPEVLTAMRLSRSLWHM